VTGARVSPCWPGGDLRGRIRCSRLISRQSRQNPLQTEHYLREADGGGRLKRARLAIGSSVCLTTALGVLDPLARPLRRAGAFTCAKPPAGLMRPLCGMARREASSPVSGSHYRRARRGRGDRANTQPALLWGRGMTEPQLRWRVVARRWATSWPGQRAQAPPRRRPRGRLSLGEQGEASTRVLIHEVSTRASVRPGPDRRSDGAHSPSATGTDSPALGPRPRRITSGEAKEQRGANVGRNALKSHIKMLHWRGPDRRRSGPRSHSRFHCYSKVLDRIL
jgi:hypothetical protein